VCCWLRGVGGRPGAVVCGENVGTVGVSWGLRTAAWQCAGARGVGSPRDSQCCCLVSLSSAVVLFHRCGGRAGFSKSRSVQLSRQVPLHTQDLIRCLMRKMDDQVLIWFVLSCFHACLEKTTYQRRRSKGHLAPTHQKSMVKIH